MQTKDISIQEEMKDCYIDYAMSVIVGRALPDVRDGLKPVHRRILYSMYALNNLHNRPYLKSARVVGDVIGKYHPHGDAAVYGTVVRMAQDFSLRYTLVDGQGNFGSIDGDAPAAMRYTEIRMNLLAEYLLSDIEKETIDWRPNYDDSLVEPAILPTRIPNLLINGSSGIAVGMATNIPPHNLTEIVSALLALLENPELEGYELFKIVTGPDFPTGGAILGTNGIISAYKTGKGIILLRGKAEIEESGGREKIIVSEIPYQVNKAKLIEDIAHLVNEKQLTGISDLRDESNREGIRVVIEIKRGESASIVLNNLYKKTSLQTSFGIIFLAIVNGAPKVLTLREQLLYFLFHRREVITRRTIFELKKAKERAHLLEGLKIAVENIDEVVALIKAASGAKEAKSQLQIKFTLTEIQAQAILDMRLQRLTGLEREKILEEYHQILVEIKRLQEILSDEKLIDSLIKAELEEIKEKFSDARKTQILFDVTQVSSEDLIPQEDQLLAITYRGYIKRMPQDTFKSQRRGGVGVKGTSANSNEDEDFFLKVFSCNTHASILFFTAKGIVFRRKAYTIPEGARTSKGRNIANFLNLPPNDRVKEIIVLPYELEQSKEACLIFATKEGWIKRTLISEYQNILQNGIRGIHIGEEDELVNVRVAASKNVDILLCSSSGKSIRFSLEDCRPIGRVSRGVKGITLEGQEEIIGMEMIQENGSGEEKEILSVTQLGHGKRTLAQEYRKQTRGGKGIFAMKLSEKTGPIMAIMPVCSEEDLLLVTSSGQVIRTSIDQISLQGRATQGVRLVRLKDQETVVSASNLPKENDNTEDEERE